MHLSMSRLGGRRRVAAAAAALGLGLGLLTVVSLPRAAHAAPSATGAFDYAEALQDSMVFYEAQRSGQVPGVDGHLDDADGQQPRAGASERLKRRGCVPAG